MYFDLHSDILYDIVQKRLEGKKNIIKDYHLRSLITNQFCGGIWCYYTDPTKKLCPFEKAIHLILEEFATCADVIEIITSRKDFNTNKIWVVLGLEGLADVKDVDEFASLYQMGFRHAMLTWNEENHFATGIKGNPNRGLTVLGQELIKFMEEHRMIIDISHANDQTIADLFAATTLPLLASHGNLRFLYSHPRNLTLDQVNTIVKRRGLIGLTAVPYFLQSKKATTADLIVHLNYLLDMGFEDYVGFGFDFMDYLGDSNLSDLRGPQDVHHLAKKLEHLNDTTRQKITQDNAIAFIKNIIK